MCRDPSLNCTVCDQASGCQRVADIAHCDQTNIRNMSVQCWFCSLALCRVKSKVGLSAPTNSVYFASGLCTFDCKWSILFLALSAEAVSTRYVYTCLVYLMSVLSTHVHLAHVMCLWYRSCQTGSDLVYFVQVMSIWCTRRHVYLRQVLFALQRHATWWSDNFVPNIGS